MWNNFLWRNICSLYNSVNQKNFFFLKIKILSVFGMGDWGSETQLWKKDKTTFYVSTGTWFEMQFAPKLNQ